MPLDVAFHGELRPEQKAALSALCGHDTGVLAAGTAFGKTVVAVAAIAKRRTNTLVLVNRRQLQGQWVAKLAAFLDIPEKEIGRVGGGANKWTGKLDVALIQSLYRKGYVDPRVKEYGHIIVDECHAVAAESFEAVVDSAPCRFVLGLSATVMRKDGHDPLIMMQLGPIRHRVDAKALAGRENFAHVVHVRQTTFMLKVKAASGDDGHFDYSGMLDEMIADERRNRMIADDVAAAVEEGRSPVLLTERREHVEIFEELLRGRARHVIVLTGGMGQKASRELSDRLPAIPDSESRVIIATGSYLGEGFDDSRLDTLFLATPVSWKGRLTQYAGRLHRSHEGKREVRIYDYLDSNVAVCAKMFEKRCRGYRDIGYSVSVPLGVEAGWPPEVRLPVEPDWKEHYADSVRRLCRDGVDAALADLFLRATLALRPVASPSGETAPAKDAVLKFLHSRLESLQGFKGLFAPAVRLPIKCGANPYIEADLFSDKLKLAVMLDGEASLADVELYRIKRREDMLMQQNGVVVLRWLAGDAAERIGSLLDAISVVVERRQSDGKPAALPVPTDWNNRGA